MVPVETILDIWWIFFEWWRTSAIARMYFKVVLSDGRIMTVFHNIESGGWYRQNY